MNRTQRKSSSTASASRWPDLQHKYGKLGNPAVVAAVVPEYGTARRKNAQRGEPPAAEPHKDRR